MKPPQARRAPDYGTIVAVTVAIIMFTISFMVFITAHNIQQALT